MDSKFLTNENDHVNVTNILTHIVTLQWTEK